MPGCSADLDGWSFASERQARKNAERSTDQFAQNDLPPIHGQRMGQYTLNLWNPAAGRHGLPFNDVPGDQCAGNQKQHPIMESSKGDFVSMHR